MTIDNGPIDLAHTRCRHQEKSYKTLRLDHLRDFVVAPPLSARISSLESTL